MTSKLGITDFLKLTPSSRAFRRTLLSKLKSVFEGRVPWARMRTDLQKLPGFPWSASEMESVTSNMNRPNPSPDNEKCMSLLYWLYMDHGTGPLAVRMNEAAAEVWLEISTVPLEEAHALLGDPTPPLNGDGEAERWRLWCHENDTADQTLLSFALDSLGQNPTRLGEIGAFLEIFAEPRELEPGITAGFSSVRVSTNLNTDDLAEIGFPTERIQFDGELRTATLERKGVRLNEFWDIAVPAGFLSGTYLFGDAPLFSLRPRGSGLEFAATLSVATKDVHVQGASRGEPNGNKDIILASLLCSDTNSDKRRGGTVLAATKRYSVVSK